MTPFGRNSLLFLTMGRRKIGIPGQKQKRRPPCTRAQSPNTAPVIFESGDYECPYCALWETVIELGLGNKICYREYSFFDNRRALFL